jgi:glycosyltransferase involved in cell wall biosynthesis
MLVRPRNPAALAVALTALLADPSRRAELGRGGRQRFLRSFTSARMASDTLAVYERVLHAARSAA